MALPMISEKLFAHPLDSNSLFINEYTMHKESSGKPNNDRNRILERFISFQHHSHKAVEEILVSDIDYYIKTYEQFGYTPDSIINILRYIDDFYKYIKSRVFVNPDIFNVLTSMIKNYEPKAKPKGVIFDLEQLRKIREYNKTDPKANYYFELVFQLGLKKEEIDICKPAYLNRDTWCFVKPNGKMIKLNSMIIDLIKNTVNPKDLNISYSMFSKCMERITKNLKSKSVFYKDTKTSIFLILKHQAKISLYYVLIVKLDLKTSQPIGY